METYYISVDLREKVWPEA